MTKVLIPLILVSAFLCACSSNVSTVTSQGPEGRPSAREQFFSDSLNASWKSRTYPVPDEVYTAPPKGYKPVYISSYARHGSRQLIGRYNPNVVLRILEPAEQQNCLTPLGKEVLEKIRLIDHDVSVEDADLTKAGVEQHRGIAERMYRNYKNVFSHKNTPVRLYSTVTQRTMMSMFSENARLLELNPGIVSTRRSSKSLNYLDRVSVPTTATAPSNSTGLFLLAYFDAAPAFSRLFTEDMPAFRDTVSLASTLYNCAAIAAGMDDLEDVDFIWDLFTYDELYVLQQAANYNWYVFNSNSAPLGDHNLAEVCPLLRDFIEKADTALAEDVPGADLRFGHDGALTGLSALIGLNGFVPKEEDPAKVIDIFQAFNVAPMAGNVQMVFYRNRSGDVLVKLLQNEVEAFVPIDTDIWPYYHWDELRAFFESRLDLYSVEL